MQNAKVFVSGGSGVIGQALVAFLHRQGAKLLVGDLKPCPAHFPEEIAYWQGDLNHIEKEVLIDFSPQYFFHLAAAFERTEEEYRFFEQNFDHNIKLSHYLLDCLKNCPSLRRIIFASSYLVYDSKKYLFETPQKHAVRLTEGSPLNPRNLCGMAKLLHEEELDFIHHFKPNISVVSARIFRSYGRQSRDIISRWIRSLLKEEPITVYAKEGMFDFIFADEVAEGLMQLAISNFQGVVNLGSGRARSIEDILHILGKYFPHMIVEEKKGNILYEASQANMDLFQTVVNWKPSLQLEDVIPKIIEYEKSYLDLFQN